ncbi:MAG: SufD family Fe-S cluster assembly protein [Nanoarchaeota archaeon]|nr:SufD family Fe-S cluster assembly protein [Nanoarchaeota archaeon]
MNFEEEFKKFIEEYEKSGFVSEDLLSSPRVIINESKVLDKKDIEGLIINTRKRGSSIYIDLILKRNVKLKIPVHMCMGVIKKEWAQRIIVNLKMESNSEMKILSHCFFPNSKDVKHFMKGKFEIGKNSKLIYEEEHFHGKHGAHVKADVEIEAGDRASYKSIFASKEGVLGRLELNYKIILLDNARGDVCTKAFGKKKDIISIIEYMELAGRNSHGLLKSRVATAENSSCIVKSVMKGIGDGSVGHVDCTEIIEGNGKISAIPIVEVYNKNARVTHEASLGKVNRKQLESLMSKGLTEGEATDVIIRGMLR